MDIGIQGQGEGVPLLGRELYPGPGLQATTLKQANDAIVDKVATSALESYTKVLSEYNSSGKQLTKAIKDTDIFKECCKKMELPPKLIVNSEFESFLNSEIKTLTAEIGALKKGDLTSTLIGAGISEYQAQEARTGGAAKNVMLGRPSDLEVTQQAKETVMESQVQGLFYANRGLSKEKINTDNNYSVYNSEMAIMKGVIRPERQIGIAEPVDGKSIGKPIFAPDYDKESIPVNIGITNRNLEAWSANPPPGITPKNVTVVLFHGNGMVGAEMYKTADTYLAQGYSVLMPTMGGYPGSGEETTKTSEATTYQDVEAIKMFLAQKGVKDVAYHGTSIGGSLAFQAAANDNTSVQLNTKFVVADKTFTSSKEVAVNMVKRTSPLLGRIFAGLIRLGVKLGFKVGKQVQLPGNKVTTTDGLNNVAKAKKLGEKGIPLIVLQGSKDDFMGWGKNAGGDFKSNFGQELAAAYNKGADESNRKGPRSELLEIEGWTHQEHLQPLTENGLPDKNATKFKEILSRTTPDIPPKSELEKQIEKGRHGGGKIAG